MSYLNQSQNLINQGGRYLQQSPVYHGLNSSYQDYQVGGTPAISGELDLNRGSSMYRRQSSYQINNSSSLYMSNSPAYVNHRKGYVTQYQYGSTPMAEQSYINELPSTSNKDTTNDDDISLSTTEVKKSKDENINTDSKLDISVNQDRLLPKEPSEDPELQPKLQNIVSTACLNCRLELRHIALTAKNAEYNPKRFAAVIMRIKEPKTTALIFSSG